MGYRVNKVIVTDTAIGIPVITHAWKGIDLQYMIPEKFRQVGDKGDQPGDNLCWLEMQTIMHHPLLTHANKNDTLVSIIKAIAITPGAVDESAFTVPASYIRIPTKSRFQLTAVVEGQRPPAIIPPHHHLLQKS